MMGNVGFISFLQKAKRPIKDNSGPYSVMEKINTVCIITSLML